MTDTVRVTVACACGHRSEHNCPTPPQPTDEKAALHARIADLKALLTEAEEHNETTCEAVTRAERAEAQLDALRQVARGYCPACGRGDAAPTVTDWEQQKQRADRAEAALARMRAIKKAPSRSPYNAYTNAQDDGWDQALDAVHAALDCGDAITKEP